MSSREPEHLSIGEVLAELSDEFPDITISKIRFLESQGLVNPERTPSGYRKFYADDLARLRWILFQQKEHFLPLKVIKERLDELPPGARRACSRPPTRRAATGAARRRAAGVIPAGERVGAAAPSTRRTRSHRRHRAAPAARLARDARPRSRPRSRSTTATDDAARRARRATAATRVPSSPRPPALDDAQVAELESYGLVAPAREVDGDACSSTTTRSRSPRIAAGFFARGVEARHLRMYRTFAEREAVLFGQVLLPYVRQRNPEARARLQDELGRAGVTRAAAAHRAAARGGARDPRRVSDPRSASDAARPETLLDEAAIAASASQRLAAEIAADHPDGVVLVGVLKGALIFLADLARAIRDVDVAVDFIAISRYAPDSGGCASSTTSTSTSTGRDVVAGRGPRRHRPHARVPGRAPRGAGPASGRRVRAARPPGAAHPARDRPLRRASRSPTCSCSATACTAPICTATSRGSSSPIATWCSDDPDAYVAALYGGLTTRADDVGLRKSGRARC